MASFQVSQNSMDMGLELTLILDQDKDFGWRQREGSGWQPEGSEWLPKSNLECLWW